VTRLSLRGVLVLGALALAAAYLAKGFAPGAVRARIDPTNAATGGVDGEYARFLDAVAAATPRDATVCVLAESGSGFNGADGVAAYRLAPRRVVGPDGYADAAYVAVYRRKNAPPPPGASAMPGGFLQKK
jgi:hypothetical protein